MDQGHGTIVQTAPFKAAIQTQGLCAKAGHPLSRHQPDPAVLPVAAAFLPQAAAVAVRVEVLLPEVAGGAVTNL